MSEPERNGTKEEQDKKLSHVQRVLVITCLVLLIAILCFKVIEVFIDLVHILAVSVFVTYTVIGLVNYLDKLFKNRIIAVLSVYLLGAVLIFVGFLLVIPTIAVQIAQLFELTARELPKLAQNSGDILKPLVEEFKQYNIHVRTDDLAGEVVKRLPAIDSSFIVAQMSGVAVSTMTLAVYGLSVLVLTFYFLLDGKGMVSSLINLSPSHMHETLSSVSSEINECLEAFFRGQIVLGLLFGVFMVLVYALMGVEYALALGLVLGIWEIVPVIGPTIGFIPAFISVLFLGLANIGGNRIGELLILIVVFNICQWIKDNVVAPRYIGDAIGLHPVLIFIAIMVGARLDGILGIIVSLPVAGVVAVLFRYATGRHKEVPAIEEKLEKAES